MSRTIDPAHRAAAAECSLKSFLDVKKKSFLPSLVPALQVQISIELLRIDFRFWSPRMGRRMKSILPTPLPSCYSS